MQASDLYEKLAPRLIDAIPASIASLKIAQPICCVRVYYFDTHAPSAYLALRIISQAHRESVLAEGGRDALYSLWASGEECHDEEVCLPDEDNPARGHGEIQRQFEEVYDLLCEDSDEHMVGLQKMLQRASKQLNTLDWSKYCKVTDDFVIAPADGSQFFAGDADYEDLKNSIPAERLELLRSRGLLGPGEDFDKRPGFQYAGSEPSEDEDEPSEQEIEEARAQGKEHERMIKEIEARALAMPVKERIAYWIDQLVKVANDDDSDMKRTDTSEGFPLRHLKEIGEAGVIAALKLACKLIQDTDSSRANSIVYETINMVRDAMVASDEVELLLREILEKADPEGGGVPANCAEALHELFKKYPEPEFGYNVEGSRVFSNGQAYLDMPLGELPKKPWWKFW